MSRSLYVAMVPALTVSVIASLGIERPRAQGDALAATRPAVKTGPAPRTADGKVDLSGIWNPDRRFIYDINDALKPGRSEEHTSELQSQSNLVCRLLLEKKKT